MTVIHVLNFAIPIVCMVFAGVLMDRACKPEVPNPENNQN